MTDDERRDAVARTQAVCREAYIAGVSASAAIVRKLSDQDWIKGLGVPNALRFAAKALEQSLGEGEETTQ